MAAFKKGDIVRLKSTGPKMTVKGFTWNQAKDEFYTDRVDCVWFDDKGNLREAAFDVDLLELEI